MNRTTVWDDTPASFQKPWRGSHGESSPVRMYPGIGSQQIGHMRVPALAQMAQSIFCKPSAAEIMAPLTLRGTFIGHTTHQVRNNGQTFRIRAMTDGIAMHMYSQRMPANCIS